jgi:Holliday junction resolvase
VSELLFSRTGRLALYLQREHDAIVGKAGTLAAVLSSLCDGPRHMSDIAAETKSSTASTARYLQRLQDVVFKRDDGRYEIADQVYALWLRWAQPEGKAVPMSVVGSEAELAVARVLAAMGFELIYQSRASRGAFDLLGVRAGVQLGLQVKRSPLPLRFTKAEWNRLHADAKRFGWRFVIAAVSPHDNKTVFLDPAKAHLARGVAIDETARIENLLEWL